MGATECLSVCLSVCLFVCVRVCVRMQKIVDVLRRVRGMAVSGLQQLLKVTQRTLVNGARRECQESEGGVSGVRSLTPRRGGSRRRKWSEISLRLHATPLPLQIISQCCYMSEELAYICIFMNETAVPVVKIN